MDAVLTPLIESPRLMMYMDELSRLVEAERVKREKFYEDISPEDKWEFINGEVVMHSPSKAVHTLVRERINVLLQAHVRRYRLGAVMGEKAMVSFTRNDYEPDIAYFSKAVADSIDGNQWKLPGPDLIVEVLSESTRRNDRGVKFTDYAAHGVAEYWIVDPVKETIEQFVLAGNHYPPAPVLKDGRLVSSIIPDFAFLVRAAFEDDLSFEEHRRLLND